MKLFPNFTRQHLITHTNDNDKDNDNDNDNNHNNDNDNDNNNHNNESFRVLTLEIRNTSLVLRCFAAFVLCIRSMLLWSIKGHDGNVSASSYLLL